MINRPTCFKNPEKPCIYLVLTNCPWSFQNSCAIETGLSDFHKLVVTVMKTTYKKSQSKIIKYLSSYKYFNNESFREELIKIKPMEITAKKILKTFLLHAMLSWVNTHPPPPPPPRPLPLSPPKKKKYVRGNQSSFMNKTLSKAIMQRSKLRNFLLKKRTDQNRNNYVK